MYPPIPLHSLPFKLGSSLAALHLCSVCCKNPGAINPTRREEKRIKLPKEEGQPSSWLVVMNGGKCGIYRADRSHGGAARQVQLYDRTCSGEKG